MRRFVERFTYEKLKGYYEAGEVSKIYDALEDLIHEKTLDALTKVYASADSERLASLEKAKAERTGYIVESPVFLDLREEMFEHTPAYIIEEAKHEAFLKILSILAPDRETAREPRYLMIDIHQQFDNPLITILESIALPYYQSVHFDAAEMEDVLRRERTKAEAEDKLLSVFGESAHALLEDMKIQAQKKGKENFKRGLEFFQQHYIGGATLYDLASENDLTRERIRQIIQETR